MRALTVVPGSPCSAAVRDVPDPAPGPGDLLVDGLAVGVCGTDHEIAAGEYGWAPAGEEHLVLGHESPEGRRVEWDAGGLDRTLVLENDAAFGSVNANVDHYRAADDAPAWADRDWPARLLTRRVPVAAATDALRPDPDGVKTVITLQD